MPSPRPNRLPSLPENAPFSAEQRAWLNGFLAGLFYDHAEDPDPQGGPGSRPSPARTARPLTILFGSQTGTAEGLAKRAGKEAAAKGFAPVVLPLNDHAKAGLGAGTRLLIITSTWGDGDPPDNAVAFWDWLGAEAAPRLDQLSFAVLGLGDRNYSEFCGAAKK